MYVIKIDENSITDRFHIKHSVGCINTYVGCFENLMKSKMKNELTVELNSALHMV